jgi:hypothetical protein
MNDAHDPLPRLDRRHPMPEPHDLRERLLPPDAVELGLSATLPAVLEFGAHIGEFGRGERGSPFVTHVRSRPRFLLVNRTPASTRPRLAVARSA